MSISEFQLDRDLLLTDPEFWGRDDRHAAYKRLRDEAPVSWHPEVPAPWAPEGGPGFWAITLYDDVRALTKNTAVFSNKFGTQPEEWPELRVRALGMLHMDNPEHKVWRDIVGPAFSPKAADGLKPIIRENADKIIDEFLAGGDVDIISTLVNSYPVRVIADMLGLPKEDHADFVQWTYDAFGGDREKGLAAHKSLIQYSIAAAGKRRADLGDDVMSMIINGEVDGRQLTDQEIGGFVSLLIGAGAETTGSSLATGLWMLGKNPDQWEKLKSDPELITRAANEFLRYTSAVINFRRTALEDYELRGQAIKKGDKVVLYYESANHDERIFENPEKFDITRNAFKQVAFGAGGPHQCLGEHLGRREIAIFLEQLISRVDNFEVIKDLMRPPNHRFNMCKQLTMRFTPNS